MTRAEILRELNSGRSCAMITLGEYADLIGFDKDETDALALNFGGGMHCGNVCGTVTGAYMAIGAYTRDKEKAAELAAEFERRFREKFGTILCKELIGKVEGLILDGKKNKR